MDDGYSLRCVDCGAGVRPIDKYCSQCGRRDPTGVDDPELNAPTLVAAADAPEQVPSSIDLTVSGTYLLDGRRAKKQNTVELQQMLQPGSIFGRRYRIQRFLGAGAMGYVCSAIDESIDEVVALKVLSAPIQDEPDAFERFKLELKLARRIRHRNVVQSFDLGFAEGFPFISMEYIDADNLLKHLHRSNAFEEEHAIGVLRQVLRGLRAAHELGIVHRDIKPENILLNKDNLAFITDFGIATSQAIGKRKELAGTPDYMSPEQLRLEAVTPATDIYSAGVMFYRMLSGSLPFQATTMNQIIDAHLNQAPAPLPDSLHVSNETRELITWMLQKKASDRPPTVNPLLERIDAILKSTTTTRSASRRPTILVVEQDADTIGFLRMVLEPEGFRIVSTGNARDGVNAAFEQTPAMIFLEAKIRGGFQVVTYDDDPEQTADSAGFVRILQGDEKLRTVPIVLLADQTLPQLDRTFGSGVADVLIKPVAKEDVLQAVKTVKDPDATLR
jgi:serine/threonine protein kinase